MRTHHCGSDSKRHAGHESHAERAEHGRDAGGSDEVALEAGDAVAPARVGHEVVELARVSSNGIAVGLQVGGGESVGGEALEAK